MKRYMNKLTELPQDLPIPADDGACDHLLGNSLPSIALPSTQGECVDLSAVVGRVVIYCYPMTGQPGIPLPDGWDAIPYIPQVDKIINQGHRSSVLRVVPRGE